MIYYIIYHILNGHNVIIVGFQKENVFIQINFRKKG